MENRIGMNAAGIALAAALVAGVATEIRADSRLNDLKKRATDLKRMKEECDAITDFARQGECMAKRQKTLDKYKKDLEAYKVDMAKEARYRDADDGKRDYASTIAKRSTSIREFTEYVNSCTEKTDRCASALFQVANLTYQNEEDEFLQKQGAYEKEYQRWEDRDRKGAEPVQPRRDHRNSIRLFERFLKEYPNHKDAPPALVRAAFVADMQGNEDRAYEYLNLMVTRWPQHALAVQAHLRIGEYWLLKRKYQKAIDHYEKVPLDYPGNEAGLALYHRAEAYYNMADFETAARWYYEYVVRADAGKIKGDLREEAMSFMAASWSDLDNGFEVAERFLRQHGNPKWEKDVYYEIGVKNKSHDRLDEAVKSFRFLLDRDPTYYRAPIADLNIVEILVIQKKAEEAQQARMNLVERYAPGSQWFRKNSGNKEAVGEAEKAIRMALYHIPVYYHQKGDEGQGDPDMLRRAEEGYRNYLNRYSSEISWDVYQIHQHLAVLYNKLKDFRKAAAEWKWCATANTDKMGKLPAEKKGLVSKQDAGFNAVVTMDDARKASIKDRYNNDSAAAYRGEETRAYMQMVDWYMGLYGNAPAAAELAYNAAILHYEAKQYNEAMNHLNALIKRFPKHKHAVLIRRALAQSLLESGRYDEAEQQFTVLQKQVCPSDKQCAEVRKALASTLFKQAEKRQKSNDPSGAAQKFQQMARDFRDVDVADKALFEAGVNFDAAGKTEEGVRLLLRIPQDYPKSELRVKAILKAASLYMNKQKFRDAAETFMLIPKNYPKDSLAVQSVAWAADAYEKGNELKRAAETYESAHRAFPKDEKTPGYLYNAGQLYENAKEYGEAISVYRLIGESYPKSQFAAEAVFSVPLLLEKKGDYSKAAAAYENFTDKYANDKLKLLQAHLGAGRNYEHLRNEKKALDHFSKCVAIQKREGGGIPPALGAEAAYRAGDIYYSKVKAVRLDGTKAQNSRKVKIMQENLVPAIKNFAQAVEFAEEEWALRATLRMGDLFYTFADISDNERVAGLSGDERVRARIESKAGVPGYLEKAAELYKKNLDLGINQGIESPWIDSTGIRFMQSYALKGQALEDLGKLILEAPLPKKASQEEKAQLQQAAEETKVKALDSYREALNLAQAYYIDNEARSRIVSRLRQLDPAAPELQLQVPQRPKSSQAKSGEGMP